MEILNIIETAHYILMAGIGASGLYFLVFSIAALFYTEKKLDENRKKSSVAVFLPAYKEDAVIAESVQSVLDSRNEFADVSVFVISDHMKTETDENLQKMGATVFTVNFPNSTKTQAIQYALGQINEQFDYALILDADNTFNNGFIDKLLQKTKEGFLVVQGHRVAKNENSQFAILDGISEEVNNAIFRKGHAQLGFSASLIGSGFIIDYSLLSELMASATAVGGFDKEIEAQLAQRKIKTAFSDNALVYDEKIQTSSQFVRQRRRWIAAQYVYFFQNISKAFKQLIVSGNYDYFDKLLQFLLPPRIIALGSSVIAVILWALAYIFIQKDFLAMQAGLWGGIVFLNVLAIAFAIPARYYKTQLLHSILQLPKGFILLLWALLSSKGANKRFIHTSHGAVNDQK